MPFHSNLSSNHRSTMNKAILALTVLAAVISCAPDANKVHRGRAEAAVKKFAGLLQQELQAAIEAGGPVEAISVCSERAPEIGRLVSTDDLTIRRIGDRVRNTATNVPTAAEREVLARFAALPDAARAGANEELVDGAGYTYYAPIFVAKPVCLVCHGPAEELATEIRSELAARYPDDQATGYALGDLRGAFVVGIAR